MNKVFVIEGSIKKRQETIGKVRESLDACCVYEIDNTDNIGDIVNKIATSSCFGDQLFIFNDYPSLSEPTKDKTKDNEKVRDILQNAFHDIPHGNVVIFNNMDIRAKKFLSAVTEVGQIIKTEQKVPSSQASAFIAKYFADKKKDIKFEDANLLANALAGFYDSMVDVDKLRLLISKLEMYIGNRTSIKEEDIFTVCSDVSKDFIVWNLYDILDKKDFVSSLEFSRKYLYNGTKNLYGDLLLTINGMLWRYRLLLFARNMIEGGKTKKEEIVEEISKLRKITDGDASEKDSVMFSEKAIYNILKQGDNAPINVYSSNHLNIIVHSLMKALIKIRVGCTESELDIIFEFLLMVICGKIKKIEILEVLRPHIDYIVDRPWCKFK